MSSAKYSCADFTTGQYIHLLEALKENGYSFHTFSYMEKSSATLTQPHVLLRHDVDRFPGRSLVLAKIEANYGVVSTFFFRTCRCSFDREIIQQIKDLGHEIGYHYETLSSCGGNFKEAWAIFKQNLAKFDSFGGVKSIAMHGRPLSRWDNRDLWKEYDYKICGVTTEAYLDIDWQCYLYFTDTGRSWNSRDNVRDRVSTSFNLTDIHTTPQLIQKIIREKPDLIISTHPERWPSGMFGWAQVFITDSLINLIKRIIRLFR